MKVGDIVVRKSYNKDIVFKITSFYYNNKNEKLTILKGVAFRLIADSPLDDLEIIDEENIKEVVIDKNVESLL